MAEQQEKAWVVMRRDLDAEENGFSPDPEPVKVYDDRADAFDHVKRYNKRARRYTYWSRGVKKG